MAKLNLEYYGGDNQYSDGEVEEEILQIVNEKKTLKDLEQISFPVLYHLSKVRENILNWYPFRQDSVCLEIGSGCGAITGLLCERMQKVISVELSKRRADINFNRHESYENLEIMVGNLNDMVFAEKFDYIILNGVFEYAMSFTPGSRPYQDFLNFIAGFLKTDGVILVAIENRLGLKYFAGAPEDHTNAYHDGLKNYPDNDSVRTFSKVEWIELMEACRLCHYKFYYPYPDYKFPNEIFTDSTLESQKYGRKAWNFTDFRFELFPEQEMATVFIKEQIMDHFVNSFLIEMSTEELRHEKDISYAKLNMDRNLKFAISTTIEEINGTKCVEKRPLTEQAAAHVERFAKNSKLHQSSKYSCLPGDYWQGAVYYPYLQVKSLAYEAGIAIREHRPMQVKNLVREVYEQCLSDGKAVKEYHDEQFSEVFGEARIEGEFSCICPANIDLILDNLFPENGKMHIIDAEWIFEFPVPVKFIIWRTINEIYGTYPPFEKQLSREEFLAEYEIDKDMSSVFWIWATHFVTSYVGANQLGLYSRPEIGVSLEEMRQSRIRELRECTLYIDNGAGFSEELTLKALAPEGDKQQEVCFDLQNFSNIKALRFDPMEGQPCICFLQQDENESGIRLIPENASGKEKGGDLFLNTDPIYKIIWKGNVPTQVRIKYRVEIMEKDEALTLAQQKITQKIKQSGGRLHFWRRA